MKPVKLVPHDSTDSRESIEMDEYSDEDDEVFLRHSRNGDAGDGARRPLMKKKKKNKQKNGDLHAAIRTSKPKYRRCCGPCCWICLAFKTLIGLLVLTIFLVNYFTHTGWLFFNWKAAFSRRAPCHDFEIIPVWQRNFPQFISNSNLRMVNITDDGIPDVIVGFGTGADGYDVPEVVCDIYFQGRHPCFGGVMALDGLNGSILWKTWAAHEIFALTCQADFNKDSVIDCLAGGKSGIFFALNGKTGEKLWEYKNHATQSDLMSVYVAQTVHDIDGDGVPEVLAVHGGDPKSDPGKDYSLFGRLLLFSGYNGTILSWMPTPDRMESYYPPQVLTWQDGEQFILFGTGGNEGSGGLFVISLVDLYMRRLNKSVEIYHDDHGGMVTPAALADITGDGIEDILIATFHSHVIAFDGSTFVQLWNTSFSSAESYSSIALGYFDEDDVPDVMVKYQFGEGYPVYQYEETVILSGKNGSKISETLVSSIGSQSSPLTLSVRGQGKDVFLHWMSNCRDHEKEKLLYSFPEYVNIHDRSRADICQSLFRTNQVASFLAFQRFNGTNMTAIYDSTKWAAYEHTNVTNTSALAEQYLKKNPGFAGAFSSDEDSDDDDDSSDPRYSMIPYYREEVPTSLQRLEEMLETEFQDNVLGLDPENDPALADSKNLAYVEGEAEPLLVPPPKHPHRAAEGEQVPTDIGYPSEHNVHKNPAELDGMQDQYENPYQKNTAAKRRGYGFGNKQRKKRGAEYQKIMWGVHRILATGSLAPPLLAASDSMDVVFASYWIYPALAPVLQPDDEKCIRQNLETAKKKGGDALSEEQFAVLYERFVEKCLKDAKHLPRGDEVYETPTDYSPLSVNMGQLTLYRFTIRCKCKSELLSFGEQCGEFLPYDEQRWPAFMGLDGDARFNSRSRDPQDSGTEGSS